VDPSDQERLSEAVRLGVVPRAIYLELPRQLHDAGSLRVAFSASLAYAFDQQYEGVNTVGIHVRADNSFHVYDLDVHLRRRRRDQHNAAHGEGETLKGNVVAYFAGKGYGFIESETSEKFFFHVAGIEDESLRNDLAALVGSATIPVEFRFGGSDGRKYPKAVDVQRAAE
jgi:cold shock CspA family protein